VIVEKTGGTVASDRMPRFDSLPDPLILLQQSVILFMLWQLGSGCTSRPWQRRPHSVAQLVRIGGRRIRTGGRGRSSSRRWGPDTGCVEVNRLPGAVLDNLSLTTCSGTMAIASKSPAVVVCSHPAGPSIGPMVLAVIARRGVVDRRRRLLPRGFNRIPTGSATTRCG